MHAVFVDISLCWTLDEMPQRHPAVEMYTVLYATKINHTNYWRAVCRGCPAAHKLRRLRWRG